MKNGIVKYMIQLKFEWKYCLKRKVKILKIFFMSNSRQFKPGAELCQAKTRIYGKLAHAEAAYNAQLSLLISKLQLSIPGVNQWL